ncbi:MAG: hypothetical protein LUH20_03740 [Lachnospiraceae bacterium]|nr:hypothetical protein [Lachnospiraceae bacterium]
MISYKILFEGIEIGILDTDTEKIMHRYTHDEAGLNEMKEKGFEPFRFMDFYKDTGWTKPIPFFENRIRNCRKFKENPKVIGYHTDPFRLVLIEE